MSIFLLGPLIKQRREALGFTQEELADGICSVSTLSRIENGERMPTQQHKEFLLTRLGYSDAVIGSYVDRSSLELHELKYRIREAYITDHHDQARAMIERFRPLVEPDDRISQQFLILHDMLLDADISPAERLERCLEAIRLTCPKFEEANFPALLSYEEIVIINNIAISYGRMKQYDAAIDLLSKLKRYYESNVQNQEETLRTQLMVLYNLSKYLGLSGKYDECIEICDYAIRIARTTRRCKQLDLLFYNKAWSLLRRGQPHDLLIAEECTNLAIKTCEILGLDKAKEHYLKFLQESFSH